MHKYYLYMIFVKDKKSLNKVNISILKTSYYLHMYMFSISNFHIQSYEDGTHIQVNSIIFYTSHNDVDFQMPMNFPMYFLVSHF